MIISSHSSAFSGHGSLTPPLPSSVVFVCIKLKLCGYALVVLLRVLAVFSRRLLHALAGLPLPTKCFNGHSAELTSLGEMMAI